MSTRNGMATVLGMAGIAVGGFYLYDRGRVDGQREAEKEYGLAGHAGSRLDKHARRLEKKLRSKGHHISQSTQEELDAISKKKDEASRSINERIEGVDRRFEEKAHEAKHGVLSWFGWGDGTVSNVADDIPKDLKHEHKIRKGD